MNDDRHWMPDDGHWMPQKPGAHRQPVENERTELIPASRFQRPQPGPPAAGPGWNGGRWNDGAEQDAYALGRIVHAQAPPKRRRPRWLPALAAVLAGAAVAATTFLVLSFKGYGPGAEMVKDDGVKACEAIAEVAAARKESRPPTKGLVGDPSEDRYLLFRRAFANSRYQDLKTAGTEVMDLIRQIDADKDLALVGAGQLVQKWSALSGACQNHGVTIPTLAELADQK